MDEPVSKTLQDKLIRTYFYIDRGNALLGSFHNLGLAIIGLVLLLHPGTTKQTLEWFFGLGAIMLPVLFVLGWYNVNRMSAKTDYMAGRQGTYYTRNTFELQKEIRNLLKQINDKLE